MGKLTQAEFARHLQVNRSTVNRWIKAGRLAVDGAGLIDVGSALAQLKDSESPLPHHQARKAVFELEKLAAAERAGGGVARFSGFGGGEGAGGAQNALQPPDLRVAGRNEAATDGGAGWPDGDAGPGGDVGGDAAATAGSAAAAVNDRYKVAMAREREAKAELAAMEVDRLAGLLLDRAEVDFVLADLGNTLRSKLEAAEDVLTEAVAPLRGDLPGIRQAVHETLREILGDMAALMKRRMEGLGK